jgi:hypothetical protein
MSDTLISDSTPHNVADLGMLCRRLERELSAANERIKRLEEAGDAMLNAWLMPEDSMEYCDWVALSADAKAKWYKAKEAKP